MSLCRLLLAVGFCVSSGVALALVETYDFSSPELEQRYQYLSEELRCPKCQNQNIADSNAPIAQDLRKLLHRQLEEGASDEAILNYMAARYGEFVRYRPSFGGPSMVLWLAPVLLLFAAGLVVMFSLRVRSQNAKTSDAGLSDEERVRIKKLLTESERDS